MKRSGLPADDPLRALGDELDEALDAIIDGYQRTNKASRNYPRKKKESPPGTPDIRNASPLQIQQAKQLTNTIKKKG